VRGDELTVDVDRVDGTHGPPPLVAEEKCDI
jgi:hypothetical protein